MLKYIKYFIPVCTGSLAIYIFLMGEYYPTIVGDLLFPRDLEVQKFSHPFLLNLSLYMNFPILFLLVLLVVSFFSSDLPIWYINIWETKFNIHFMQIKESFNIFDKISLIMQTTLSICILGTVPAHELTHRKRNKLDMFIGNWLLAFTWDCAFAIEHVYGHHKYVCLPEDPASAKRGENVYLFIVKGIVKEHIAAWKIEINRMKRQNINFIGLKNRMIIGYFRSLVITMIILIFGGVYGMLFFLLCSLLGKCLLEAINYIEHYGLVREMGKPVCMRHSWNSNHFLSSIYLYNVTRHSDHHRVSNLKYWELNPIDVNAPNLPYGYLSMLFLLLLTPYLYHRIMAKKIIYWDLNYASDEEKRIAEIQNFNSGIAMLKNNY